MKYARIRIGKQVGRGREKPGIVIWGGQNINTRLIIDCVIFFLLLLISWS